MGQTTAPREATIETLNQESTRSIARTTLSPMAMGKRRRPAKQASMWVATQDLPCSAAHPFYTRLNQILDKHAFDGYVQRVLGREYLVSSGLEQRVVKRADAPDTLILHEDPQAELPVRREPNLSSQKRASPRSGSSETNPITR